jgi:amino-acid racemase
MKKLGMIGGVSWHSTAKYYSKLNELAANHYGGYASCKCIVNSLDFAKVYEKQRNNDWDGINSALGKASQELLAAGVEKIILCTNTYHKATEWQEHLPKNCFIDIAVASGEFLKRNSVRKAGFLGTMPSMTEGFIIDKIEDSGGLEILVPDDH